MPELKPIISPRKISQTVKRLAREIEKDYASKTPVLIGVLKGSFVFLSDLIKELAMPLEIDFIRAACYGMNDVPSGRVCIAKDIETDIEGRDVIVVEDIVDRGATIRGVMDYLKRKKPSTIKLCALLLKDGGRSVRVDYLGATVGEGFVVGYGMDYKEKYRNIPGICVIDIKSGD